jgi:hypothetical protein
LTISIHYSSDKKEECDDRDECCTRRTVSDGIPPPSYSCHCFSFARKINRN